MQIQPAICAMAISLLALGMPASAQVDPGLVEMRQARTLESVRLDTTGFEPQRQSNLCWAATLATVVNHFNRTSFTGCEIASSYLNRACCDAGQSCNRPASIQDFDQMTRPFGIGTSVIAGRASWDLIRNELRHGRPVLIRVESALGQGHFINIVGYDLLQHAETGRTYRVVLLHDPMYGFYKGEADMMGYSVHWENLLARRLVDYEANWTHTAFFNP